MNARSRRRPTPTASGRRRVRDTRLVLPASPEDPPDDVRARESTRRRPGGNVGFGGATPGRASHPAARLAFFRGGPGLQAKLLSRQKSVQRSDRRREEGTASPSRGRAPSRGTRRAPYPPARDIDVGPRRSRRVCRFRRATTRPGPKRWAAHVVRRFLRPPTSASREVGARRAVRTPRRRAARAGFRRGDDRWRRPWAGVELVACCRAGHITAPAACPRRGRYAWDERALHHLEVAQARDVRDRRLPRTWNRRARASRGRGEVARRR